MNQLSFSASSGPGDEMGDLPSLGEEADKLSMDDFMTKRSTIPEVVVAKLLQYRKNAGPEYFCYLNAVSGNNPYIYHPRNNGEKVLVSELIEEYRVKILQLQVEDLQHLVHLMEDEKLKYPPVYTHKLVDGMFDAMVEEGVDVVAKVKGMFEEWSQGIMDAVHHPDKYSSAGTDGSLMLLRDLEKFYMLNKFTMEYARSYLLMAREMAGDENKPFHAEKGSATDFEAYVVWLSVVIAALAGAKVPTSEDMAKYANALLWRVMSQAYDDNAKAISVFTEELRVVRKHQITRQMRKHRGKTIKMFSTAVKHGEAFRAFREGAQIEEAQTEEPKEVQATVERMVQERQEEMRADQEATDDEEEEDEEVDNVRAGMEAMGVKEE